MDYDIVGDKLTYKIDTEEPIEIKDLIKSLSSISEEYAKFSKLKDIKVKLSEVRKGSFEFDLILTSFVAILPFMSNVNTTVEFIKRLNDLKDYFLNINTAIEPTVEEATMLNKMNRPIHIVNNGSVYVFDNNQNVSLSITKDEAKSIATSTTKYIEEKKKEEVIESNSIFKDRLIKFVQTRTDNKDYGNKSVCEHISESEIKTTFESEEIKKIILDSPYHFGFLVDLEVQYLNKEPKVYRIMAINDKIDLSE